ncbi:MAG: hypothetical protein H7A25_19755 [Leptospiraceae bacterium]|nr:hypothetical protein [Leptospiraceae bacterium]MCP5502143.1 hypothetical protein [Leptospiraceae bacterium]
MQCKTFCGTDITRIEEEINGFLSSLQGEVSFVSQSQGESDYGHLYTLSVWYTEEKAKKVSKKKASKKKTAKK